MLRNPPRLLGAILIGMLTAPPASTQAPAAQDRAFTARLEWESGAIGAVAMRQVPLGAEPPQGVTLPAGMSSPRYARIALGAGAGLAIALDPNPGNPRLWVDRDFDGDLAEERAVRFATRGTMQTCVKTVLLAGEEESQPSAVDLWFSYAAANGSPSLSVRLLAYRRGTAVLGGRLRVVALVDGNQDARFDDPAVDRLYVDLDGNGELEAGGREPPELIRLGEAFRVGDEGWTVTVPGPSGAALWFERAASVPPARLREWTQAFRSEPGAARRPPDESLEELLARYQAERDKPYAERYRTISLIGDVGTAQSYDALVEIAETDEQAAVQTAALRALGNPACLAARGKELAARARKANNRSAGALAQALHEMGHPEREAIFVELVESSDATIVSGVARWLALVDGDTARASLLAVAQSHTAPAARYGAYAQGLRSLPGGPPIDAVLRAAKDDYPMLAARAIEDLGELGHPDAVPLALEAAKRRPVDRATGLALAQVLGAAGSPRAVEALLGLLEDEKLPGDVRKKVGEQLRCVRAPQSLAIIVAALKSDAPAVRALAGEVLAANPEPAVTAALLKTAKKEKDETALAALLGALGDHGDVQALETLLKHAQSSRRPEVRAAAVRALARLGFHVPKVRTFFLAMLESRDWVDRVLALDAAAASREASLAAKVLKSLGHDRWQVRVAAVEALDALRVKAAVLPLIERLDVEEEQRIRDAIARTLFRLTGVAIADTAAVWRLWWSENGQTFEVPEEIPTLPENDSGGTSAGFFGIPVATERVVFVLDQSGSMSALGQAAESYREESMTRLEVAVREAIGAITRLPDKARVNVIMFHTTITPWTDELQRLGPNRKRLTQFLERQQPTGGTNIYDPLELALRLEGVDTIFLLSDGMPGAGKYVATADILRGVRNENQTRRIAIHCIAVGMDSELLRKLALENGGRYVRR